MVNERVSRMVAARAGARTMGKMGKGESVVVGVEMTKGFVEKWKFDKDRVLRRQG